MATRKKQRTSTTAAPAKTGNGREALPTAAREIPTGEDAEQALRVLADLNDRVKRLEAIEANKKDAYQSAKADREAAQDALGAKLWQVTHPAPLPLFGSGQPARDPVTVEITKVGRGR
jgi:hypothetical protein